ncbi:tail fiber assembly protein [Citrobacter sp. Awk 4]|uniref:tail fiber assembly protein n=1 Tax=Citrobacter sp. Awk 4 TaxID=2963955 RepID=UPI002302AA92|nr:tail fiber assembly protein [Citrobacter sp. Awk 4]MDA8479353.1 tail fiber assembly protein [Citrobacter sp. Awk 4]
MTAYFYSPSENAFYATGLKEDYEQAGTWPDDGVEIDDVLAEKFMNDAPEGKTRASGDDGLPCWVDIPPPTIDELIERAEVTRSNLIAEARDKISLWQTELQLGIISDDDKASLIAWMKYIQALNAVDTSTAPDIEWPVKPE